MEFFDESMCEKLQESCKTLCLYDLKWLVLYSNFLYSSDDSTLTVDPSPDRNATLKSAVQALMREKALEKVEFIYHNITTSLNIIYLPKDY